ncbi:hypothetical protein I0Q91_10430 [Halanaerobiaceae bacterium Z-7014]|uniref:Uncharacterized protein n=1 Tax=Halonatronomonas betaini TaxID=2778430 RepID=A0A931AVL8_9FIRM|nr:hypothetical protein [Halonatronomonas betaini]MBF8437499.1 hypothetical protein [Halonatronomonas betaini]
MKRILLILLMIMVIGTAFSLTARAEDCAIADNDKADPEPGSLTGPAYQTIQGELSDIGTGEMPFLVFSTSDGDYLVANASYGRLQNLKGLSLLLTGRIKDLDAGPFLGQINVEEYNTYFPDRPNDCPEADLPDGASGSPDDSCSQDWQEEISILGKLVAAEGRLYLLSRDQLVVELLPGNSPNAESEEDDSADTSGSLEDYGSISDYTDEEIVITGSFRQLGDYSGELEVKSYRVLSE